MTQNVPSKGVKMPMDYADWNDYNTRVVCEIFVDQVATGLGWDNTKEIVTATAERWKQLKADIPGCTKFMKAGLQNEELLQKMFEDIRKTGADHWSLGQGTIPTATNDAIRIADDNEIDEETEEDEPSAKRKKGGSSKMDKFKKSKSGSQKMIEEMSKSNELSTQTLSSIQSFTKIREDPPGCSIKDVMALVEECGVIEGTNEHFIAIEIFIKKDQRKMFVNLLGNVCQFIAHSYRSFCMA